MIVSFDVASLYTSIPLDDARAVVEMSLSKPGSKGPPVHFILQLVDLLLEKNYFKFEGDFYYQVKGVAMGSSFAPSLANLFMAHLEDEYILNAANNPYMTHILIFWRFIDDCLRVFTEPSQLDNFLLWLNSIHPSISFTMEGSTS